MYLNLHARTHKLCTAVSITTCVLGGAAVYPGSSYQVSEEHADPIFRDNKGKWRWRDQFYMERWQYSTRPDARRIQQPSNL
jgi:hypothetical protein